ncbi:hypothetical protein D9756_008099 [Leucocoprinus leucothites]|uniref:Uncharacterized protein n=1 Tax=Leucocoprinus leucothites TaxID=201217 RepID=A0A8H5D4W8_9AGAR|nr:hypothetical protein D9756_008099 [Leucoagaricus leucothites]
MSKFLKSIFPSRVLPLSYTSFIDFDFSYSVQDASDGPGRELKHTGSQQFERQNPSPQPRSSFSDPYATSSTSFTATPAELSLVDQIFAREVEQNGWILRGGAAVRVFSGTKLRYRVLGDIWAIVDEEDNGWLSKTGTAKALRLIGHAQSGAEASPALLNELGPLAKIEGYTCASEFSPPGFPTLLPEDKSLLGLVPNIQSDENDDWKIGPNERAIADAFFKILDVCNVGFIRGDVAAPFMSQSKLPNAELARIWRLADINHDGRLTREGFAIAFHLIGKKLAGRSLPTRLPRSLILSSLRKGTHHPQSPSPQTNPPTQPLDIKQIFPTSHNLGLAPADSRLENTGTLLSKVLQTEESRIALRNLRGDQAQVMIEYLYSVLFLPDILEPWLRKYSLIALYRLCKATLLYPRCYVLKQTIEIVSHEGGGGFSDIYRGRLGDTDLCLKVVRLYQKSDTDTMLKIYAKEAIIWGHLHHPNIVPFYGIFYFNERQKQRYPSAVRTPFVYDVASGLEYLHSQELVHSDLKGMNILVDDFQRACITDFGLSFVRTNRTLAHTIASSTVHGFSNRWAAPELLEDDAQATQASDIWAFGCVCYEILTGLLPFNELSEVQLIRALLTGSLPGRTSMTLVTVQGSNRVWNAMEQLIWEQVGHCWIRQPEQRPNIQQILLKLQEGLGLFWKSSSDGEQGGTDRRKQEFWDVVQKGESDLADLQRVGRILRELSDLGAGGR